MKWKNDCTYLSAWQIEEAQAACVVLHVQRHQTGVDNVNGKQSATSPTSQNEQWS